MKKDIVIFDCETTGTDTNNDRIVQIAMMKCTHDFQRKTPTFSQIFNPEMPIPTGASEIHGITDDMVKDAPLFRDKAEGMAKFIGDCDLAGFNSNKFDVPLLITEFARCGIELSVEGRRLLDSCTIFHEKEKRDLTAALKFYCNKEMENAHTANADVDATFEIFKGQIERYDDINNVDDINIWSGSEKRVDIAGFLCREEGQVLFAVGKHKGKLVSVALKNDQSYLNWLRKNSPKDTIDIIDRIMSEN